jgi:8-oxo-dGTP pyrophosphatase MutT (NUDIX family)
MVRRGCLGHGAGDRDNAGVAGTSADAARRIGIRLSALAQDGLTYAADDYDRDRYRQLGRLAAPSAAATREILEETGYHSSAVKLIACWDRELQDNPPPLPVHVYKLFFLCRRDGAVQPPAALETLDVGWFGLSALPPLSLGRVSHRQLERALAHHRDPSLPSEFD